MNKYATIIKCNQSDSQPSPIEIIEELSDDSLEEEEEMNFFEADDAIQLHHFQGSRSLSTIYEDEHEEGTTDVEVHSNPNTESSTRKEGAGKRPTEGQNKSKPLWTIRNKHAVPEEGPILQIEEGNAHGPTWVVRNPYAFNPELPPEDRAEGQAIEIEELNSSPPSRRKCRSHNVPSRHHGMPSSSSFRQEENFICPLHRTRENPIYQSPCLSEPLPFVPPIYQIRTRPRFSPQLHSIETRLNEHFRILLAMFTFLLFMGFALFGFAVFLFVNGVLRSQ